MSDVVTTDDAPQQAVAQAAPSELTEMWKMAKALSLSTLMPALYQKKPENCFIALEVANRLGLGAFEVAQNLFVVKGTPGFSSKYMIALANMRGPFTGNLQFVTTGEGPSLAVECWAVHKDTGERVSVTVTMAQAKAAKWTNNAKYGEIPEQMLVYRAATFFVRRYCPEVTLGVRPADEIEGIRAAGPADADFEVVDKQAEVVADVEQLLEGDEPKEEAGIDDDPESDEREPEQATFTDDETQEYD